MSRYMSPPPFSATTAADTFEKRRHTVQASDRKVETKLTFKANRPKYSIEFNKWLDQQKEEDPTMFSDMQAILTPESKSKNQN